MLNQYSNILVPLDGSKESSLAFEKAIIVAKRNNANLHILHVIDTRAFQSVSSFDSEMVEQVTKKAKETIDNHITEAKKAGLENVNSSIQYGSPKLIISQEYPQKNNIDLIMIGATGLNAVERLLIGSVTEYVTRTSACDVLVVRTNSENK